MATKKPNSHARFEHLINLNTGAGPVVILLRYRDVRAADPENVGDVISQDGNPNGAICNADCATVRAHDGTGNAVYARHALMSVHYTAVRAIDPRDEIGCEARAKAYFKEWRRSAVERFGGSVVHYETRKDPPAEWYHSAPIPTATVINPVSAAVHNGRVELLTARLADVRRINDALAADAADLSERLAATLEELATEKRRKPAPRKKATTESAKKRTLK